MKLLNLKRVYSHRCISITRYQNLNQEINNPNINFPKKKKKLAFVNLMMMMMQDCLDGQPDVNDRSSHQILTEEAPLLVSVLETLRILFLQPFVLCVSCIARRMFNKHARPSFFRFIYFFFIYIKFKYYYFSTIL